MVVECIHTASLEATRDSCFCLLLLLATACLSLLHQPPDAILVFSPPPPANRAAQCLRHVRIELAAASPRASPFRCRLRGLPLLCSSSTHPLSPSQQGLGRQVPFPGRHVVVDITEGFHLGGIFTATRLSTSMKEFSPFFFLFSPFPQNKTFFRNYFFFSLEFPQLACNPCPVRLLEGPRPPAPDSAW